MHGSCQAIGISRAAEHMMHAGLGTLLCLAHFSSKPLASEVLGEIQVLDLLPLL